MIISAAGENKKRKLEKVLNFVFCRNSTVVRYFSFRLLYRVVFFSFCLIFACFYHGGGSEYDRREDETEPRKLKEEFNSKPLNSEIFLKQDKYKLTAMIRRNWSFKYGKR